jgi:hypothetical protein
MERTSRTERLVRRMTEADARSCRGEGRDVAPDYLTLRALSVGTAGAFEGGLRAPDARGRGTQPRLPASTGTEQVFEGVQLELRCQPEVLLSRAAASAFFGRTAALDAWADFLEHFFPAGATFVTLTYSDEGGEAHKAYRPAAVFGDIHRFFGEKGLSYDGPAFFATEEHRYRRILHAHGLMRSLDRDERTRLMALWAHKRGWARMLPATAGAFPYVCKYALKAADGRGDCIDLTGLPSSDGWTT